MDTITAEDVEAAVRRALDVWLYRCDDTDRSFLLGADEQKVAQYATRLLLGDSVPA